VETSENWACREYGLKTECRRNETLQLVMTGPLSSHFRSRYHYVCLLRSKIPHTEYYSNCTGQKLCHFSQENTNWKRVKSVQETDITMTGQGENHMLRSQELRDSQRLISAVTEMKTGRPWWTTNARKTENGNACKTGAEKYCKMSAWKARDGCIALHRRGPFGMRKLWQSKQKLRNFER